MNTKINVRVSRVYRTVGESYPTRVTPFVVFSPKSGVIPIGHHVRSIEDTETIVEDGVEIEIVPPIESVTIDGPSHFYYRNYFVIFGCKETYLVPDWSLPL